MAVQEKSVLGRGDSQCKGPGAGTLQEQQGSQCGWDDLWHRKGE